MKFIKKISALFEAYLNLSNLITSLVALLLGILTNFLSESGTVSVRMFVFTLLLFIFVVWFLLILIFNPKKNSSDLVLSKFYLDLDKSTSFCVIKPNTSVSKGSYLTIFYNEENLEYYLSTICVENIQANGLIKANVLDFVDNEAWLNMAKDNNSKLLSNIIIKTTITEKFIERLMNNG